MIVELVDYYEVYQLNELSDIEEYIYSDPHDPDTDYLMFSLGKVDLTNGVNIVVDGKVMNLFSDGCFLYVKDEDGVTNIYEHRAV